MSAFERRDGMERDAIWAQVLKRRHCRTQSVAKEVERGKRLVNNPSRGHCGGSDGVKRLG